MKAVCNISSTKLAQIAGASLLVSLCVFISSGFPALDYAGSNLAQKAPSLPPYQYIGLADAIKIFNDRKAVIVDARSPGFYNAGHIEGAINIPAAALNDTSPASKFNISSLKQAGAVMVYCSSSCGAAAEVGAALAKAGVANVMIYDEGWPEWRACHLPSSQSESESPR